MAQLTPTARPFAMLTATALLVSLVTMFGDVAEVRGQDTDQPQQRDAAASEHRDADRDAADHGDRRSDDRPDHRRPSRHDPGHLGQPPYQVIETPLDEETVERVLDLLQETQPYIADRLEDLREENADHFESAMSRIGPHALYMANLRDTDPTAFDLRRREQELGIRAMHLARQARSDEDDKAQEARDQLKEVLEEQFDVRTRLLEHEMAQLEERLEHLRARFNEQQQERDQFVERRYEMILQFSRRGPRGSDGDRDRRSRDRSDDDDD